jgi:hypothetical protein
MASAAAVYPEVRQHLELRPNITHAQRVEPKPPINSRVVIISMGRAAARLECWRVAGRPCRGDRFRRRYGRGSCRQFPSLTPDRDRRHRRISVFIHAVNRCANIRHQVLENQAPSSRRQPERGHDTPHSEDASPAHDHVVRRLAQTTKADPRQRQHNHRPDRVAQIELSRDRGDGADKECVAPVVIPGTDLRIGGSIDRLDLAAAGDVARVTDYKSGKPPRNGSEPVLRGGAELQRCLYAFAVRSLLPVVNSVGSRLLYPKAADDGLYSLADPDDVLFGPAEFAAAAARLAAAGKSATRTWRGQYLQRFCLRSAGWCQGELLRAEVSADCRAPGRSRTPLGDAMMPGSQHFPALPDAGARQRALLDYNGPASVRKRLPES